ncbi:YqaJ viral recombinase family protein [Thermoclostridium stercorarium]|uniref:YqaJ viral recombinase family nuclease n=1 Tax=Thermoclostridium stercorarium TaxID=1510 RepID=UPI00224875FE|nr:YqaJ viral recombinase family protein [Thermoclostridium stercorarium]UZQ86010.1 YqaJ viral recombinase family protein [Thermoclostridium stercorarium]
MSAVELAKTLDMPREQWLKLRKKGIGGSDAAAIIGLDRYRSPFDVYADKLGLKPEIPDNEAMRQGRDLEQYVAERFMEATGKKVRRRNAMLQHPEYPFMIADIDRWVVGENAGLECKTTSVLSKYKFSQGEFPPNYYVQCMHYMAVTGAERWYLAVLVLNKAFHVFTIERDEAEIQALIAAEKDFWESHVMKQIPPAPDGSEATSELIKQLFPEARERAEVALFGYEDKIQQYLTLDAQVRELEQERDKIKQELQLAMADAEIGRAQGYIVEWKNQIRQTLDTQRLKKEQAEIYTKYLKPAQTVRMFKIKEVS